MKLVIDIPDEIYNFVISSGILCENELFQSLLLGVRYGTPLPKEHGDLVDRDTISVEEDVYFQNYIIHAPIVIPAERGDNNGVDN